jgi:predicted glutamine amidotransferase
VYGGEALGLPSTQKVQSHKASAGGECSSTKEDFVMCQLLGMSANTPTDINFSFSGFARRGGETDHHADGWGIAFFEERGVRCFVDSQAASRSPLAGFVRTYPIRSRTVIAHIRKATHGDATLRNCHPFIRELWGRNWVFAHNGDLGNDFHPRLHAGFRPVGETDSELAFCWIMQELAKAHAGVPTVSELSLTLGEVIAPIAAYGTFNVLLSNGEALWAHASTQLHYLERKHPFASAELSDEDLKLDFAMHTTERDVVTVIATTPLTTNEAWSSLSRGELATFVNGQRI